MLTSQDLPGFWCAGRKTNRSGTAYFRGMLTWDQIEEAATEKFDFTTTLFIPATALLVYAISQLHSPHFRF